MSSQSFPEKIKNWTDELKKNDGWNKCLSEVLGKIGFNEDYVERIQKPSSGKKSGAVKDNIWGMIEFGSDIAAIINSPILQRLRRISQLGFTSYTYPTANHTRFAHTLGVFYVVRQLLNEVDATKEAPHISDSGGIELVAYDVDMQRLLQMAAILHDIGHGPFSHVSENYLLKEGHDAYKKDINIGPFSVQKFITLFNKYYGNDFHKLSELISVIIITSDLFIKFYDKMAMVEKRLSGEVHDVYKIATLILGDSITPNDVALSSILSGAVDADKIDYMRRDAGGCGISLSLDFSRVFLRAGVYKVKAKNDPFYANEPIIGVSENDDLKIFVIDKVGGDTVTEMAASRVSLYRRVYHHPFTRIVESHFYEALKTVAGMDSKYQDYLYIWSKDEIELINGLANHRNKDTRRLAKNILMRDLPKRAASYAVDSFIALTDFFPLEEKFKSFFQGIRRDTRDIISKNHDSIGPEIIKISKTIREKLKKTNVESDELPLEKEPIFINVLSKPNTEPETLPRARIITPSFTIEAMDNRESSYTDAGLFPSQRGYVLVDGEKWREIVALAFQEYIYSKFKKLSNVTYNYTGKTFRNKEVHEKLDELTLAVCHSPILDLEVSSRICKINVERISSFQQKLGEIGYYDRFPTLISAQLKDYGLESVVKRFNSYQGDSGWKVTEGSLQLFIRQFPPKIRSHAATLIKGFNVMDREAVTDGLIASISKLSNKLTGKLNLVPFTPSSGHLAYIYLSAHDKIKNQSEVKCYPGLREALSETKPRDNIVFIDDHMASGTQALKQIKVLLGQLDPKEMDSNIFFKRLTKLELKKFRSRKISFAFCYAREDGKECLHELFEAEQLTLGTVEAESFEFLTTPGDTDKKLMEFLTTVGTGLELARRQRQNPSESLEIAIKKSKENALGYDNLRGVTVTPFNVPTSTITAFWRPGTYCPDKKDYFLPQTKRKELPWVPLLLRSGELKNLVIP